jgi:hypothetical protein
MKSESLGAAGTAAEILNVSPKKELRKRFEK